jgi:hypothetical protein
MAMNKVTIFAQSFRTIDSGAVDPRSAPAHR